MAKGLQFTEQDLIDKGYVKGPDGAYHKTDYALAKDVIKASLKRNPVPISTPKQPVVKTPEFVISKPIESFLTIPGIVAGLNGSKGLMRAHWSTVKKQKDLYRQIVRDHFKSNKVRQHEGMVKITYTGYKSLFCDWDNFVSSFKHIGDSLVKEGVIVEDNPKIVVEFIPKQIKCKRSEQKVVVIIQDV